VKLGSSVGHQDKQEPQCSTLELPYSGLLRQGDYTPGIGQSARDWADLIEKLFLTDIAAEMWLFQRDPNIVSVPWLDSRPYSTQIESVGHLNCRSGYWGNVNSEGGSMHLQSSACRR
jgi:hypothetical protein